MIKKTINLSDYNLKLLAAAFLSVLALLTFASPARANNGDTWIETLSSFKKGANNYPGEARPIRICSYRIYEGYVLDSNGDIWHWASGPGGGGGYSSIKAGHFPGTGTPVDLNCGIDEVLSIVRVVSSTGDLFDLQVGVVQPCTQNCPWSAKLNNNSLTDVIAMHGGLVLTKDKKLHTLSGGNWSLSADLSGIMVAPPVDIGSAKSGWGFASYPYVLDSNGNIYWRYPSSWVLGANNYPGTASPIATDGGYVIDGQGKIWEFNDITHMGYLPTSWHGQSGLVDLDMIEGQLAGNSWRHYYYVEGTPSPSTILNVKVFYDKNSNGIRDAGEDFTSFGSGVALVALDGMVISINAAGDYATLIAGSPATHFLGIDPNEVGSWSVTGCGFSDSSPCSFTIAGSYYNTTAFSIAEGSSLTVYLGVTEPGCSISITPASQETASTNTPLGINYQVQVESISGFTGSVALSTNDLTASNINLSLNPILVSVLPPPSPAGTSTLNAQTSGAVVGTTHTIQVSGIQTSGVSPIDISGSYILGSDGRIYDCLDWRLMSSATDTASPFPGGTPVAVDEGNILGSNGRVYNYYNWQLVSNAAKTSGPFPDNATPVDLDGTYILGSNGKVYRYDTWSRPYNPSGSFPGGTPLALSGTRILGSNGRVYSYDTWQNLTTTAGSFPGGTPVDFDGTRILGSNGHAYRYTDWQDLTTASGSFPDGATPIAISGTQLLGSKGRTYYFQTWELLSDNSATSGVFPSAGSPIVCTPGTAGLTIVIKPWIKTTGGDVGSIGAIGTIQRTPPAGQFNADYLVIAQGAIDSNFKSAKQWLVGGYSGLSLGSNVNLGDVYGSLWDKFGENSTSAPASIDSFADGGVYYSGDSTDFTVSANPSFSGSAVLFVDGDLFINSNITCSGRIVFVVSGNITVASDVGNLHGYFIANGNFIDGVSDEQLVINGGLAAFGQISFTRTYTAGPAEQIGFDPGYLWFLRDQIGCTKTVFRELAP